MENPFIILTIIAGIMLIAVTGTIIRIQNNQIHTLCVIVLKHDSNNKKVLDICSNVSYTLEEVRK